MDKTLAHQRTQKRNEETVDPLDQLLHEADDVIAICKQVREGVPALTERLEKLEETYGNSNPLLR